MTVRGETEFIVSIVVGVGMIVAVVVVGRGGF